MSTRSNPAVPQSPVVINGWFDRHFSIYRRNKSADGLFEGGVSPENFNIMPRELGFVLIDRWDKILSRPDSARGSDYGPRIFTSVNAFPATDLGMGGGGRGGRGGGGGSDWTEKLHYLRQQVRFVGVPLVAIDAANANQKDGVAICVAGSTSIFNTGNKRICTGQLVMWDFPPQYMGGGVAVPPGQPSGKRLFMTVPADAGLTARELMDQVWPADDGNTLAEFKHGKRDRHSELNPDVDVLRERINKLKNNQANGLTRLALTELLAGMTTSLAGAHRRVIGLALSSAEPGEQFDILFRSGGAF